MVPASGDVTSPFGSLSPQAPEALLQRKEEYSRKLRENWQAERVHLEASRARAEEMFREERDIMDQERLLWVEHKQKLETEVEGWKQRTEAAEAEVARLTRLLQTSQGGGRGHIDDVGNYEKGHISSSSTSPGTGGPSNFTFRTPSDGVSPGDQPHGFHTTIPESNPFVPLDPRMQGVPQDSAAVREERKPDPVPSIDINEVIPGLEGIRLRAPAIQRSTFNDGKTTPPTTAPGHESPANPTESLAEPQSKAPSTAMTASEHRRLTMHAGHTPSHSMSFARLPIVEPIVEDTAADSAEAPAPDPLDELEMAPVDRKGEQQNVEAAQGLDGSNDMPEESTLEPSDEAPALKGPLCLRNRPATDEIFLRRLSDKLEEVMATDASPSVLNEPANPELTEEGLPAEKPAPGVDDDTVEGLEDAKFMPLKFKNSSNFGQPLGQARRTSD